MQSMDFKIVGGKEVIWELAGVRRRRERGKFPFINACHAGYLVLYLINFVRACRSIKVMFTLPDNPSCSHKNLANTGTVQDLNTSSTHIEHLGGVVG